MKRFTIVFLIGIAVFIALDFVSAIVRSDSFDDPGMVQRVGFPLVYETGPDYQDRSFSPAALLTDIGIAVLGSALVAVIFARKRGVVF